MKKSIGLLLFGLLMICAPGCQSQAQEKTFTNDRGMEFVLIPAGSFIMGSDEMGGDESPAHKVTISQPFYLGTYEVTQEQWESLMGNNPSNVKGPGNPVEQVNWDDVQAFIEKLNENESSGKYRLPTEAEWEYAARAGTDTIYSFGNDASELDSYAWHRNNSEAPHPVGQKQPNPWGLYDMYGNVAEWVQDWFGRYAAEPVTDPQGPPSSSYGFRVYRGGSWMKISSMCQSVDRDYNTPDIRDGTVGFRLAFSPAR